jgi:hypothetical protein
MSDTDQTDAVDRILSEDDDPTPAAVEYGNVGDDDIEDDPMVQSDPAEIPTLDLTREISPSKKLIRLGAEDYELKNYDWLSPQEEAAVTATFARFMRAFEKLGRAKNDKIAQEIALKLQTYRVKLIALMTTVPTQVINTLGPGAQGKLLSAVQDEISADNVLDEDDDEEVV